MKTLHRVLVTVGAGAMLATMVAVVPAAATSPSPLAGYASGTYTTIDYPGAVQTDISGINNLGMMVGFYIDTAGVYHGFIYQNGTFTPFNDPNAGTKKGQGTQGSGINDFGTIVGGYIDGNNKLPRLHGTRRLVHDPRWAEPEQTGWIITPTSSTTSVPSWVLYTDPNLELHGFLYRDGTYTTVNDPLAGTGGSCKAQCSSVLTTLGWLTGDITTATGQSHGLIDIAGRLTTVDNPNAGSKE